MNLIQVRPPDYFTHISITAPIVSALKNYYIYVNKSIVLYTEHTVLNNARHSSLTTAALATIQVRSYTNYLIDENLVLAK